MSLYYDLHAHTYHSDGVLTPEALIARAHGAGLQALAVTDHDCLDGLEAASLAAQHAGIRLIPGVEISVTWSGQTLHVVGLRIDRQDAALQAGLLGLQLTRDRRAEAMGEALAREGIPGAYEGARALASGRIVSRTHFARFLFESGHVNDIRDCFRKWLGKGCPGYVSATWVTLEEAIGWIRGAGGDAVLAHPARYRLSASALRRLLVEFKAAGGAAIEVVSSSHSEEDARQFARHASEHGLLASAGSDFHAPKESRLDLGTLPELPAGCEPLWHSWGEA